MKTLLYLFLILLLISCEKLDFTHTQQTKAATQSNLTIQIHDVEQTPFSNTSTPCTRLNYGIYTEDGTRLKQINQQQGETDFGIASFQLPAGTYHLLVLAHSSNGNPTMTTPAKIQFKNNQGYTDTFMHYATITVGTEEQTLTPSLDRIVSMCRFVINDSIPDDVTQIKFNYTGGSGAFDAITGLGCVNSKQEVKFDVTEGQTWTEYDLYTFLHKQEDVISLKATALDAAGNNLCQWDFEIPMQQNQITLLSGYFFIDQPITDDWSLIPKTEMNSTWKNEIHLEY